MKRLIKYAILADDGPYTETLLGHELVCFMLRDGVLWVKYRDVTRCLGVKMDTPRIARDFGLAVYDYVKDENNLKNILQNTWLVCK